MKTISIILVSLLCLMGLSSFTVKPTTGSNVSTITSAAPQDHCPKGYICEATNCVAQGYSGKATGTTIERISVYKNSDGDVIAFVPGHGQLRCYWSDKGMEGWHFNANGGYYVILGY